MLKTLIKRDGTVQEYDANKANGWGEFAAKTLGSYVDWSSIVLETVSRLGDQCTTLDFQKGLIYSCLNRKTWEYNRMAGRLYAPQLVREFYGDKHPTVQQLHAELFSVGLMVYLNYSSEEYAQVEDMINHNQDLKYAHFQIHQIRTKYALRNKVLKKEYETPQFVFMRMAMALAENEPKEQRMEHVKKWYTYLSKNKINAPTPNYVNLGTRLNGYASCCVYTTHDTAASLAAGDHIAYMMTCMSAGIGSHIKTRSLGDPIRGGLIEHQGKLPYYRAMVGAIGANLQNGRGGASTVHYTAFDPEVKTIQKLRHPMTPAAKRIAGAHYSFGSNKLFARKVARDEMYAPFSYHSNPELYNAQYAKDQSIFERLYMEYEKTATFKLSAREVLVDALRQAYETGVQYDHRTDELNKHTPFIDPIWSSNLCQEIGLPSKGYQSVKELYEEYKEGDGEIGLCSLGGVVVGNIDSDEEYADVAYYTLKMIDVCIHKADYVFPSLEHTAKSRMSAGVGVIGLAHLMAKKHLKFDTQEGRNFIHETFETHYWHLLNASLRLGKELGNAPWMHKTLWPKGWLPLDTYNKNVDSLVTVENKRDWEWIRKEIIANGGIRNSVLVAHMPAESSASASGTTNGVYPIRSLSIMKTNDTATTYWEAPDAGKLGKWYQLAWDISNTDHIKNYAVEQKWTDQGISADIYADVSGNTTISSSEIIQDYLSIAKYGLKSRYYVVSKTSAGVDLTSTENAVSLNTVPTAEVEEDDYCESCAL